MVDAVLCWEESGILLFLFSRKRTTEQMTSKRSYLKYLPIIFVWAKICSPVIFPKPFARVSGYCSIFAAFSTKPSD